MDTPQPTLKEEAVALFNAEQFDAAKQILARLAAQNQADTDVWIYLIKTHSQLGEFGEMERCCRQVLGLMPNLLDAHYLLGAALVSLRRSEEAIISLRRALQLKPDYTPALFQFARAQQQLGRFGEAITYYKLALQQYPEFADAHEAIGTLCAAQGNLTEAAEHFRAALRVSPNYHKAHSDLVLLYNYSSEHDADTIFSEHVRWGQNHALTPLVPARTPAGEDPDRRLRIGYVSPDFYRHSVSFFIEPLLANYDAAQFEIFCYASVLRPDSTTERLRGLSQHWLAVQNLNNDRLAEAIYEDRIDILVDLSGHTGDSRLVAFTRRPAPIQISYLGYPNTTGSPAIDYRLTDAWADPPGMTERYHTEKLLRIPNGFLCYRPPADAPPVVPSPAAAQGFVTFGSFNNLTKVTPEVVALWAAVLKSVPDSRLVFKNRSFQDGLARKRYLEQFKQHGIMDYRLELLPPELKMLNHLHLYGRIDISLDTFPYNGTTTTVESLLMGVPVVTLAGRMHAGRVGASILSQVRMEHLIAQSKEEYIRIAVGLAEDVEELSRLRSNLRQRVTESHLCDERSFAAEIEQIYRRIWVQWCTGVSGSA
ncbi:MAG: tetratricopeptide repeat protein [Gammaproteobacteria bacterium]